jgi:eukaryotic-like serine/threonine-protein kinase
MDISTIGRYQILERLGQGGMGVVYRAFDPQIERTVAIKVISTQLVDQPEHRERFFREARAAGRLAHRNIITIFDLGEDRGQPYIAMEYVQGQALDVRMRAGEPLTLSQKVGIIIDICDALAFAHEAGIIHRDMKPANVMLTMSGSVRILDFGLARLVTSELTRSNIVVGTMNYMAPEQVRAEAVDHRADVFSVGVLLYELLSGHKAFEADSFAATMYKVLQERPAPLESLGAHALPAELLAIVDRAIEKDPEQRYQSMGDMLLDLELVRAALPPAAPIRMGDATDAAPRAPSARPSGRPLPEPETTLDAPRVPMPGRTPPPSRHAGRSSTEAAGHATPVPGEPSVSSHPGSDASVSPAPSPPSSAPGGRSPLLAIVSAAALVMIAIAVIAFVVRGPGDRTPPAGDDARRGATERPSESAGPVSAPRTPPAAPPAAPEAPVSVTDDLTQQTESARALYRAGKYDEAASAAGRVLKRSPGNADAQRLMADVARYARQAATEAVSGLAAARTRAESAGAPASAAASFARAVERERSARALLAARDYAKATTAAYAAQGLFDAAAAESLGRTQARAAAEPVAPRASPPPRTEEPRVIQFPAVQPMPPPAPAPAPAPSQAPAASPPAASPPPRAPAASERRSVDPQEAVRRALQQYSAALEARSLPALKQVWPGLGGAQERAIKTEFDNARRISVTLESPRIDVAGDTATVVATRHYSLATVDGHELRSDARSTFQLRAAEGGWVIESIRFEAAR